MTKISTQSFSNFATASMLAIALTNTPVTQPPQHGDSQAVRLEYSSTSPSNKSLQVVYTQATQDSIESRISSFYSAFSEAQVELGSEYESLIISNLSSLYED